MERYLEAQQWDYAAALRQIRQGRKQGHWIWYIFPQIAGLGRSDMAQRYAIRDLDEARAYGAHPVLGARLREITAALLALPVRDARAVMGGFPDDLKLCSCMTLFEIACPEEPLFGQVLDEYFAGQRDEATLRLLGLDG